MRREITLMELECRGRQEAAKWLERIARAGRAAAPENLLSRRAPELASPAAAQRFVRETLPHRFFAGAVDADAVATVLGTYPDHCRTILDEAEQLLTGRFNLLGYRELRFGDPPDWHLDPVSGRRAPLLHWSRIDPLDDALVGDAKVTWELNRHQWLVRLAQAYALGRDERYARACVASIDSWLEANPPGVGINWASSLEVAYRLISWCWTVALIRESACVTGEWAMNLLAAVCRHAQHVRRYLSYYFSPNTHLTGEALGLFYAGTLFQEFEYAPQWVKAGADILIAESAAQILPDGVHFELSTCYQRYTIDIYLHFLQLAARNDMVMPDDLPSRVEGLVDALLAVRQPDGSIPQIGDADGGTLLPLAIRKPDDARGVFARAACAFGREDFAWAAEGDGPEAVWMMGQEALTRLGALKPAPPAGPASVLLPSSGYAVMRSGWQRDAHQLIVDAGPLGCPISSGHGHADLLSIQCAIFGEPCLVDPGTGCYASGSRWRDYFRSTAAHSTLRIDGRDQARPAGPFRWQARPAAELEAWESTGEIDVVDASHTWCDDAGAVIHRRRVFFLKPHYWVLVDDVSGASAHAIEVRFQFAPIDVAVDEEQHARALTPGGNVLWIVPFASSPIAAALVDGWVSPDYGQQEPAPQLTYSSHAPLPWRMLMVLLPQRGSAPAPPSIAVTRDELGRPTGITFEESSHVRYRRHFAL